VVEKTAMMRRIFVLSVFLCSAMAAAGARAAEEGGVFQRRWVYLSFNNQVDASTDKLIAIMEQAKKAGYNGALLADYKFLVLNRVIPQYFKNIERVRKRAAELDFELAPAVCPIGYSNGLLAHDVNLAEGIPVKDAPYVVKNGEAVLSPEPAVSMKNGGFEESKGDKMLGFGFQDDIGASTIADKEVFHGGKQSLRMQDVATHNKNQVCRVMQQVAVRPFACYRLSAWVKTKDYTGGSAFRLTAIGAGDHGRSISFYEAHLQPTQEWTELEVVLNSMEFDKINVYAGQWGGKSGSLWLDDLKMEELSLVNILRRDGCPLTVTSDDGKTVYEEGKDFLPVIDSKLGQDPYEGCYKFNHQGPALRIKDGSRIKDGEKLKVTWYHPVNIHDGQMACCLSEPKVYDIMREQIKGVNDILKPKTFFMSHDEIRCANWCKACTDRHLTPGQLLADNVKRCESLIHEISPGAKIMVWNDMFDPFHNAVEGPYYLVNGPWTNSWEGLSKDTIIANWNGGKKSAESLKFFADRGHEQLIAGYYDGDDLGNFNEWNAARKGIPRVTGFMYTTWEHKFNLLEKYGEAIKNAK
jgi:hypothetical protein